MKLQIKQSINWFVGMIIIISSKRKLHHFDNFWTFKTQNTECNYIHVENYEWTVITNQQAGMVDST